MADGLWLSTRKGPPKRLRRDGDQPADSLSSASSTSLSLEGGIPLSLLPHLGWTRLSSHSNTRHERLAARRRAMRDCNDGDRRIKVMGCAIFFVHNPPESGGDTVWFQGRFFPSTSSGNGGRIIGGDSIDENRRYNSPTSVLLSSEQINHPIMAENSWGILATQNALVDECLACEEGGYRELDLTFIRRKRKTRQTSKTTTARWAACDIVWTGGNMMTLNASSNAGDCDDEDVMKFEPRKLVEGDAAMSIATRYFPEMTKRLRIHNVLSCDNKSILSSSSSPSSLSPSSSSAAGKRSRSVDEEEEEEENNVPMIIIGDMQVSAPASFIRMKGVVLNDHNDKWNEDSDSI